MGWSEQREREREAEMKTTKATKATKTTHRITIRVAVELLAAIDAWVDCERREHDPGCTRAAAIRRALVQAYGLRWGEESDSREESGQ
jgi:hypothetical protein